MIKKVLKWLPALFVACCNIYLSSQEHIKQMRKNGCYNITAAEVRA